MDRKAFPLEIKAIDEEKGIVEGYAATFSKNPDSYGDIIDPGAFTKTLKEQKDSIVSLFNHNVNEPIGLPSLKQDDRGLFVSIKLVPEVQKAREVLALIKAGVVKKMSIGFDTVKQDVLEGVRHLKEVRLYDVSPVVFAANPEAVITGVKSATSFADLPLADRDMAWEGAAAAKRVREWAGGDNINWGKYQQAFFWYDSENPELFGSYKLGFADIVEGKLSAVPRGIFAVAVVLRGGRGGVDIPDGDKAKVIAHLNKYYAKMDMESPFKGENMDIESKSGRVLSAASRGKVSAAIEALQALLDAADAEPEPEKSTPLPEETKEAAESKVALDTIQAEIGGFDTKAAEARIEAILAQINI